MRGGRCEGGGVREGEREREVAGRYGEGMSSSSSPSSSSPFFF